MSTWALTEVAKASDCNKVYQPLGSVWDLFRVPTPIPQLASQSVLLRAPGQASGDCLARPRAPD